MVRFVDEDEIDTRYWEKPYYLVPDGDVADEAAWRSSSWPRSPVP